MGRSQTAAVRAFAPAVATPIVPSGSIAGRSLTAVVAIMTFLAALTSGAVMLVAGAASDWQSEVGREVTIQVRPASGRDIEADVRAAIAVARAAPGIAMSGPIRVMNPPSSSNRGSAPDSFSGFADPAHDRRQTCQRHRSGFSGVAQHACRAGAERQPRRSPRLDRPDAHHGGYGGHWRLAILGLVLAVTVLSVTFATRGAMATNRVIIEVLHYVGATDGFVASQFQRHFLILGLRGGAIGGGAAIVLFGVLEATSAWLTGTAGGDEAAALFGSFSVGVSGYLLSLAGLS